MGMLVLIADSRELMRRGLRTIFTEDPRVSSIQEATSSEDLHAQLLCCSPDLLVIQQSLVTGVPALPRGQFVILAAGLDERICFAAHSHGARRYLLETASAEMIRETLRLTGEMFLLDPVLMPRILENAPNGVLPGIGNQTLIPREQEVFRLLNDGLTQRAIGERLCISQATVKTHVAHILRKLDMKRRPVLAFPAPACAESHAHSPYQITASKARRGSGR